MDGALIVRLALTYETFVAKLMRAVRHFSTMEIVIFLAPAVSV